MRSFFLKLSLLAFLALPLLALAAKPGLVLLPIQGDGLTAVDRDQYRAALAQGLSGKYQVFSGADVDKKLDKFAKKTCNDEKCLQEMAIAYQASLIGRGVIAKEGDGYIVTVEIRDAFTDQVELSDTRNCPACGKGGVIDTLKRILAAGASGGSVNFATSSGPSGPAVGGIQRIEAKTSGDTGSDVAILVLDSDPSGADVYLSGIKAGTTPYQNLGLQAGQTLTVTLKLADHHDQTVELPVKGGTNEASIKLRPAWGGLAVTSTPPGASVLLGGKVVGTTPWQTDNLASGKHLLSVRLPLHAPVDNRVIEIQDGKLTRQDLKLEARYGTLSIPGSGNAVEIRDAKGQVAHRDTTPAEIRLEPGRYTVELARDGHESNKFDLTVAQGKPLAIGADQATLRKLEGTVIVSSEPFVKGADVYVDGAKVGQAPATLKLPAGKRAIKIVSGDQGAEQQVEVQDRKTQTLALKLAVLCKECPDMVDIPAGSFEMGSNENAGEKPVHRVTVPAFAIGKHEVTQAQWSAVMGANPSKFKGCDTCPVEQVSWDDIQGFLQKLNTKTGKRYRLPSESEWEYACRAGGKHAYCGSENLDAVAWYDKNSGGKTHPVGQKLANAFGLHDMSGNVWEWTADCWNENYAGAPTDGSVWTRGNCGRRVLRGGSWISGPQSARSAIRIRVGTADRSLDLGFRVALSPARTH